MRDLPVRDVLLGTAGRVAISVVGRWGLRVSSSEGFPQLVERARDVGRAMREVFEELPQPLQHFTRITRNATMCRLEVIPLSVSGSNDGLATPEKIAA
jgi:hypothetical protein